MRKIIHITLLLLMAFAIVSCKEKKESNVIIAPKPVKQGPKAPVKMSDFVNSDKVPWLGKEYQVEVKRAAADSLPMVKDEQGNSYYDNLIRVRVTRQDGSEFFNRVFSKRSFNDYIDDNTRKKGVLLGIVFDRAEGDNLIFGASVGSPDRLSDEYIPLILTIGRMGTVGIQRDTQLDSVEPQQDQKAMDIEEEDGV